MSKRTEFDKVFTQGYSCAVANIIRLHGDSTIAEDVYLQNMHSVEELVDLGVDEEDIEIIIPLVNELNRKSKIFKTE